MRDLSNLPKDLFTYFLYSYHSYQWKISLPRNLVLLNIHDKLISYDKDIKTPFEFLIKEKEIKNMRKVLKNDKNAFFAFSYKARIMRNRYANIEENRLFIGLKKGKRHLYLESVYNVSSDYPRNKKTGELVDLTPYAKENRKFFNGLVRYLCEVTGGEVVDVYPKETDKNLKQYELWQAEEIDRKGFRALSERKEEYEEQERRKRFRRKFGIFGRFIP